MAFNYFENASNIGSAGFANGNTSTVVPAHQLGNLERAGPDGKLRGVDFVGSPSLTVSPSGNSAAVNGIQNLTRHHKNIFLYLFYFLRTAYNHLQNS